MSLTRRVVSLIIKLKETLDNKCLQRYVLISLSFFFLLGILLSSYSVNAQTEGSGSDSEGFLNPKEMHKEMETSLEKVIDQEGMFSSKVTGTSSVDSLILGNLALCPQCFENYEEMAADPEISPATKLGAIGILDIPIALMLYNPPQIDISEHLAQEWIPNYEQSSGLYASSGYQMLTATPIVVEFWGVTRNIAYMLFVIVFIIAGFMIMFRHKLGGQTMVTVYNTLPNIIVGLILVTFSFAIVGFLIDIGAIFIRVITGEMNLSETVDATHPLGVMWTYSKEVVFQSVIKAFTVSLLNIIAGVLFLATAGFAIALISLIVAGAIAFASIKIFFVLIKAYIGILFDTIAAPIVFAIATIPGRQGMMKDWFNRVMKNVMVFVLVFFLINLPLYLMEKNAEFNLFGGDLQGGSGVSVGEGLGAIILAGISIYLLFLATSVPKMLEEYFPQTGGKGGREAGIATKAEMAKIPLVGGFFKG